MAGSTVDYAAGNFGGGPQQIIGGTQYSMYSPAWYAAMDANKVHNATVSGQAAKAQTEAAMPDSLKALLGDITGSASGGLSGGGASVSGSGAAAGSGVGSSGTGGVSAGAALPGIQLPDQTAAVNARYATAKDQVGQAGRASIDALRGELGATGMLGGGAEGQLVTNQVNNAFGQLGQVSRDEAGKQADIATDVAKTNYAGGITQRGQDVSAREAEARLATEKQLQESSQAFQAAQLKSQQQLQMLSLALGGLKTLGSY